MRKTLTTVFLAVAAYITGAAQIPSGYYDTLKGKCGADLKDAVYELIHSAKVLEYGSGSGKTWSGFYKTDRLKNNQVVDRYSDSVFYFSSTTKAVSGMNIEHSFAKSWWGGKKVQAYKDLYNLMPCEQKINGSKGNYPMGKVRTVTTTNNCTKIGTDTHGYTVWEPADKWKGDFARGYMYMATTYQNYIWQGAQGLQLLENDTYPTLKEWAYKLFIEWARTDTVDSLERSRNEAVSKIQGNRNPFVDFPNLMEYIWGDSAYYAFDPSTTARASDIEYVGVDTFAGYYDPSQTYEIYDLGGKRQGNAKGVIIIRQKGKTYKVARP